MNMDETDRLRRAFTATFPTDLPRRDCPPAEEIWQAVRDELSPPRQRELVCHVAVCPLCTEAWRVAMRLERIPAGKAPAAREAAVRYRRWTRGLAAVAVLALALGGGLLLRSADDPLPAPSLRQDEGPSIELLSVGPLSRVDWVLDWQGPEETLYYRLRVTWADGSLTRPPLADESELTDSRHRIPAEAFRDLPPNARLLVHIEAVPAVDGQRVARVFEVEAE